MSQTFIETITSKIDGILKNAEQEREILQQNLAEAQGAASEARSRMEAATASADVDAYHAAKQDETVASTAVEMYTQRLSQISSKYLVSEDENASTVAAIHAEQKKLADTTTKQIISHMKEIEKLGKAYFDQQDALNRLIVRWHQKVYKQAHRASPRLEVHPSDLHYDDKYLRGGIHSLVTMYFYRKNTGRDQYHDTGSIWK